MMATVEKKPTDKKSLDTTSFISNLHSALDISESMPEEKKDTVSRYFYSMGQHNFLLEQDLKVEFLTHAKINKVPYLSKWHKGIISIRGIIMPVIDLHEFLGTEMEVGKKKSNRKTSLLMIDHKDHTPVIFEIENLPEIINIKEYKTKRKPKGSPNWQEKYLGNGNNTVIQINHKDLLEQIIKAQ